MRPYSNRGSGSLSPRSLASALPQGPPYSLVNGGLAHTREAYRDLLIFEERLKQNSERLASQRRKYEAFLLSLILSIFVLSYRVLLAPSPYKLVQYATLGLLLIAIVTLILFFATGVYSEKIAYAYKFVPQANRALRYFNIYLNTKRPPRKWSLNPLNLFRSSAALSTSTSTIPTPGLARVPSTSGLRTSRSRSPQSSSSSSSSSSFSAISSRNPVPLAPLPPANNPRGELIFSSKVSQHYRDGYDKYRSDWERRRQSTRKPELSYTAWLASFIFPSYGSSKLSTNKDMKTSSPKKKNANGKEEEKRNSSTYAEQSDSSSVEQSSVPPPSSSTPSRGRDSRTRPLARSGSSSSISSAASGSYIPSQTISRRSSPLRQGDSVAISSSRVSLTSASPAPSPSDGSSRASTPDLIREEEEDHDPYAGYRQHPRRSSNLTGSSVSISTVSSQSFHILASTRRREQQFIRGSKARSENERYDDSVNDDDDDDTLPSPPDLSPNSKQANLSDPMVENNNGMKKIKRRSRASSFNEFLAELREEGLDT